MDLQLKEVELHLNEKRIPLEVDKKAKEYLAEKGYDPNFGARPLRRLIQNEIEDTLSEELLSGNLKEGDKAVMSIKDGALIVKVRSPLVTTSS